MGHDAPKLTQAVDEEHISSFDARKLWCEESSNIYEKLDS
jgi:hypothetical protein